MNKCLFSEFVLKIAKPGSLAALESLFRSAFSPYVKLPARELDKNAYSWLAKSTVKGNTWDAYRKGKLVAALAITPVGNSWSIDQIAVSVKSQGQGIGSWMLERPEDLARSKGIEKLTLDNAKVMIDLVRLYERFGFVIVREGQPKHDKDSHTRAFMEKPPE